MDQLSTKCLVEKLFVGKFETRYFLPLNDKTTNSAKYTHGSAIRNFDAFTYQCVKKGLRGLWCREKKTFCEFEKKCTLVS